MCIINIIVCIINIIVCIINIIVCIINKMGVDVVDPHHGYVGELCNGVHMCSGKNRRMPLKRNCRIENRDKFPPMESSGRYRSAAIPVSSQMNYICNIRHTKGT